LTIWVKARRLKAAVPRSTKRPGHCGAGAGGCDAGLGGRRIDDAVGKILADALHQMALRPEAEDMAADQADAPVFGQRIVQRVDHRRGKALRRCCHIRRS
jgi:hypothetical protein